MPSLELNVQPPVPMTWTTWPTIAFIVSLHFFSSNLFCDSVTLTRGLVIVDSPSARAYPSTPAECVDQTDYGVT